MSGLRRAVVLDTATAGLLSVSDGSLSARAALHAVADLVDADPQRTIADAMPILHDLVADGLLVR